MINFILGYWIVAALVVAVWAFNEVRKIDIRLKSQVDLFTMENMKTTRKASEKIRKAEVNKLLSTLEKQRTK